MTERHQPSALAGLAVVIRGPGAYRTRCGEVVRVERTSARNDFGCVGAHADGTPDGWHRSGRLMPWSHSRDDVVAPVGRDAATPSP